MNKLLVIVMVVLSLSVSNVYAKKLYKWVDENGKVTYSDLVPPEQIKKEHQELNQNGVVLEKIKNIKTPEERQAEREAKQQQIKAEKLAVKLEIQRKNIIKSYTNEQEIVRLKEERLSALERNIESAKQSLDFQKTSREQLLSMAAANERGGQKVSKALKSRIDIIAEKINYQLEFIQVKKQEISKVVAKFDNDLLVYREAKQANK
ncbi:MAG: DUF4124 domain-containing protein [Proteobacteria bacterium]|nr:DUF4124 domain-containing protein [Pseudomonadota bacterium]